LSQEYPEATVGGLVVRQDGKVLLVKSHKWSGLYSVPGGHVEFGEKLEDAVVREVAEETGLRVKPRQLLLVQDAVYAAEFYRPKHFIFFDYLCDLVSGDVRLDREELQEYAWLDPVESLQLELEPYTRRLVESYIKLRTGSRA
jgi:nucleoside triphosphatase